MNLKTKRKGKKKPHAPVTPEKIREGEASPEGNGKVTSIAEAIGAPKDVAWGVYHHLPIKSILTLREVSKNQQSTIDEYLEWVVGAMAQRYLAPASNHKEEAAAFLKEIQSNPPPEDQTILDTLANYYQQKNVAWFNQMRAEASDIRKLVATSPEDISAAAKSFTEKVQAWMLTTVKRFVDPATPPFIILALGSFARKEMAPYSDMDFVVICDPKDEAKVKPVLEAYTKIMRQNLLDRDGGFSVDDVTGNIFSPEGFKQNSGRDTLLLYQNSPKAMELYQRFLSSHQQRAMKSDMPSEIVMTAEGLLKTFNSRFPPSSRPFFKPKLSKVKSSVNVKKHFLEPLLTPISMLAEYSHLANPDTPEQLNTPDRLTAYIDDKKLRAKMLGHFDYFFRLRYLLHNKRGKEDDELVVTDAEWQDFEKRLETFRKDYKEYIKFIKKKVSEIREAKKPKTKD